jgi:hypothetical protein
MNFPESIRACSTPRAPQRKDDRDRNFSERQVTAPGTPWGRKEGHLMSFWKTISKRFPAAFSDRPLALLRQLPHGRA